MASHHNVLCLTSLCRSLVTKLSVNLLNKHIKCKKLQTQVKSSNGSIAMVNGSLSMANGSLSMANCSMPMANGSMSMQTLR